MLSQGEVRYHHHQYRQGISDVLTWLGSYSLSGVQEKKKKKKMLHVCCWGGRALFVGVDSDYVLLICFLFLSF